MNKIIIPVVAICAFVGNNNMQCQNTNETASTNDTEALLNNSINEVVNQTNQALNIQPQIAQLSTSLNNILDQFNTTGISLIKITTELNNKLSAIVEDAITTVKRLKKTAHFLQSLSVNGQDLAAQQQLKQLPRQKTQTAANAQRSMSQGAVASAFGDAAADTKYFAQPNQKAANAKWSMSQGAAASAFGDAAADTKYLAKPNHRKEFVKPHLTPYGPQGRAFVTNHRTAKQPDKK